MALLFVPPTINKYYILDISPGRSMIEWLLGQQQQVFIQSLVNPPLAGSRASYRVVDDLADEPEAWKTQADVKRVSWWPEYGEWLARRPGSLTPAPKTLGSGNHKATAKAPGSYVHAS